MTAILVLIYMWQRGDERPCARRRTRLAGGFFPSETHSSSATGGARKRGWPPPGSWRCSQIPGPVGPIPRYAAGSKPSTQHQESRRCVPTMSMCKSDPGLRQYSFAEFASKIWARCQLAGTDVEAAVGLPR